MRSRWRFAGRTPSSREIPCPRCSTPGITYWHTPDVCEQDWVHDEMTFRIGHAEEDLP